MRKEIVIGICFAVAGILCACLFGYEYFSTYGFLNAYHMRSFADAAIDLPTLLGNIVWKRSELFLLVWLLTYTPVRKVVPLVLRCLFFFTAGMFAGACMINMGGFGLIVFLGSWIPHGFFYLAAVVLILRREVHRSYRGANVLGKRIAFVASILSFILIGCVAEATVGTWILQKLFAVILR